MLFKDPGNDRMKSLELLTGASLLSARFRTILDLLPDLRPFLSPGKGTVADRADLRWQIWFLVRHLTSEESATSQLAIRLECCVESLRPFESTCPFFLPLIHFRPSRQLRPR